MTDTVTEVFSWRLKSWVELAEEEDEYLEELQNQNKIEEAKQAGKQLTNFQKRLIERIKNRTSCIEVGLQKVPSRITIQDIRDAFKTYQIRDCQFKRSNCFFQLPKEEAIRLVEEGKQRITIQRTDLLIVILPIRN